MATECKEEAHSINKDQYTIDENNEVGQWYDTIAQTFPDTKELDFMNYGYADLNQHTDDEDSQCCMKLYEKTVAGVPFNGKDILEVSCGRGVGAASCVQMYKPRSYIGVDISPSVIALCRKKHSAINGLSFVPANASERLPFPNESFDIVLSVEATHAYGGPENVRKFAHEVARVLRPNGYLLWCDTCHIDRTGGSIDYLTDADELIVEDKVDITKNVLQALDLMATTRRKTIERIVPSEDQANFSSFAGIPGTEVYEDMREGRVIYWRAVLRKKINTTTSETSTN